jgi:ABC-type multidrug transport system fused ATPase/permease subunit
MVAISVFCAFFVGFTMTAGLGTMLPILQVLIHGDTVQAWFDRQVAEQRLGVTFAQDTDKLQVIHVTKDGPAAKVGIEAGDEITDAAIAGPVSPYANARGDYHLDETLRRIAWADGDSANITVHDKPMNVPFAAKPWYGGITRAATVVGLRAVELLPITPLKSVAAVLGFLIGLNLLGNFVRFFQEYLSDKASILAVNDIRRQLYDRVLHIPMQFFGQQGTSDVTSRLVSDSNNLQEGFKTVLGQSIQQPINAAMALGLALILSWKLTLFIIFFGPLMFFTIKKFGKKMRRASRAAMQSNATMLGQVEGTLMGIRVVKAANAERFERRRYMKIMAKLVGEQLHMSRIDAFTSPVLEVLMMLMASSIVMFAAYMVLSKPPQLTPENFVMVMISLVTIAEALRRSSKLNNALQKANAAAVRIFETLDLPAERPRTHEERTGRALLNEALNLPGAMVAKNGAAGNGSAAIASATNGEAHEVTKIEVSDRASATSDAVGRGATGASSRAVATSDGKDRVVLSDLPRGEATNDLPRRKLPMLSSGIHFENITFAYPNTSEPALDGVDLPVARGRSVAIVGRNGSGKTTLLALLPRFFDPQAGRVTIDGIDVRTVTLASLRKQISIVTQDSVIFPGTIAENIAYGNPLARRDHPQTPSRKQLMEEIEEAARRAFAHEFILAKPAGYDCLLGEMGGQLSGGQKQRLCIARAILRKSPILILDEATSQVDAESEHLIQQAIERVMHERTTFVIAHRFSTIISADSIVVMERGKIVGQGKHDDLLRTCETYQQLYERQLFATSAK